MHPHLKGCKDSGQAISNAANLGIEQVLGFVCVPEQHLQGTLLVREESASVHYQEFQVDLHEPEAHSSQRRILPIYADA